MTRAWLAALSLLACDCSGEAFTVGDAVARFDGGELAAVDDAAPGGDDAAPAAHGDGGKREAAAAAARDAGDPPHPVMTIDAGGDPVLEHDASAPPPAAVDAGTPSPPPALCCMTPCSGSSVAPITCGNGPAWTCAAGSCSEGACSVGTACQWMGSICTGHVAVCP